MYIIMVGCRVSHWIVRSLIFFLSCCSYRCNDHVSIRGNEGGTGNIVRVAVVVEIAVVVLSDRVSVNQ